MLDTDFKLTRQVLVWTEIKPSKFEALHCIQILICRKEECEVSHVVSPI